MKKICSVIVVILVTALFSSCFRDYDEKGKILFEKGGKIYIIDTDGQNLRCIADDGEQPSWSPDGTRFVFYTSSNPEKIYMMNHDGTGKRFIINGKCPTWSPDGKRLVYANSNGSSCYTINAEDGSDPVLVRGGWNDIFSFSWSPDGKKIVANVEDFGPTGGTVSVLYIFDSEPSPEPVFSFSASVSDDASPTWSPDGSKILYCFYDIYVINPDDTENVEVVTGNHFGASWSPDGKSIVYSKNNSGADQLCISDADGKNERVIYSDTGDSFNHPSWQGKPR